LQSLIEYRKGHHRLLADFTSEKFAIGLSFLTYLLLRAGMRILGPCSALRLRQSAGLANFAGFSGLNENFCNARCRDADI